jgi:hypothetical protein
MSKITEEKLLEVTKAECNQGFPYFKHGFSSTRPHSIEQDLEVAERIRKILPDCFSEVECDTSDNLCGNFTFRCKVPNENVPHKNIEASVHVNRYGAGINFGSIQEAEEFFKLYVSNPKGSENDR